MARESIHAPVIEQLKRVRLVRVEGGRLVLTALGKETLRQRNMGQNYLRVLQGIKKGTITAQAPRKKAKKKSPPRRRPR